MSGFKVVSERPAEVAQQPAVDTRALAEAHEAKQQAARWLVAAMQVVSQRFISAVALAWVATFHAALVASAWWLWWTVLAAPDVLKLVGGTIYSLFVLAVMWLRRA